MHANSLKPTSVSETMQLLGHVKQLQPRAVRLAARLQELSENARRLRDEAREMLAP